MNVWNSYGIVKKEKNSPLASKFGAVPIPGSSLKLLARRTVTYGSGMPIKKMRANSRKAYMSYVRSFRKRRYRRHR